MTTGKVIARGGLNLRQSPKTGKVVKLLRRSSRVEILSEETWLRVETTDGSTGFVSSDFIEREPAAATMPAGAAHAVAERLREFSLDPSDVCVVETYHNSRFVGREIRADVDFFSALDRINALAEQCGVKVHVTSSFRDPDRRPSGAIVPPATRSNHFVGHAIDMNLVSPSGFFNSSKLKRAELPSQPAEVRRFIELVQEDEGLRWGGDFSREDPVHIDDNLNNADPDRWQSKVESLGR